MTEHWHDANSSFHPMSSPDFLPREQLRALQRHRLRTIVGHAYHNTGMLSPERPGFYREKMDAAGVKPEDIRSLDDIRRLPLTVKSDLRDTYPSGLFAVAQNEIVRVHASSGTTGKPIVVAYTAGDVDVWAEAVARSFLACGLRRRDVVQVSYGYGLFTGGLGAHYGAERLGMTVIPTSSGNTERQLMLMADLKATAICCTPSYFLHMIERAAETGTDLKSGALPLRAGVFGAEPWSEEMRGRIESATRIKAYDIYGLSEITGPGVACECTAQRGAHIFEDHFYPEIIDPETGEVLPDGAPGELVLTTLSKRAMPLLRYRTRDLTSLSTEPCACGRSLRRIMRIGHRSDDMMIVRGVNVFPSQVEAALLSVEGAAPHYFIVLRRERDLDRMEVQVEMTPSRFSAIDGDSVASVEKFRRAIQHAIYTTTGISADIRLMEPGGIPRSEGKAKRVRDERKI